MRSLLRLCSSGIRLAPALLALSCSQSTAGAAGPAVPTATVSVLRTDVSSRQAVGGTIGYAATVTVPAPSGTAPGAIVQARVPFVVYGTTDPKAGACDTLYRITSDPRLNHRAVVLGGVLRDRCAALLSEFFQARRSEGKK